MTDREVLEHINRLVAEEHELFAKAEHADVPNEERQRLEAVQASLDQCWDLLRQRRARRSAGQDPERARVRDVETVEHYRQ